MPSLFGKLAPSPPFNPPPPGESKQAPAEPDVTKNEELDDIDALSPVIVTLPSPPSPIEPTNVVDPPCPSGPPCRR